MADDVVAGDVVPTALVGRVTERGRQAASGRSGTPSTGPNGSPPTGPGGRAPNGSASTVALSTELRGAVETTLTAFLDGEVALLDEIDPAVGDFARTARECVLAGGKRLRPTFAYWGWRGVVGGLDPIGPVLPAFAALELLHTFALVHDDVMDASASRRGRPTAHRVLAAQHAAARRDGDGDRFGEAAAVLVGDLCLVWADRMLSHAALPPGTLLAARRCYDRMRIETVAGQYLDILGDTASADWSVDRAMRVARYKTAHYTVQRPLLFGAALADLRREMPLTRAYSRYGLAVGEAFQLRDDLLGVYGDPRATGKPVGDDLRDGKPTVLLMLARQLASPAQLAQLDAARRGRPGPDPAEVVTATGAVDRVERMINERVEKALTALDIAPIDPAAHRALTELAVMATRRRS